MLNKRNLVRKNKTVELHVYNECKYMSIDENPKIVKFDSIVKSWEVKHIDRYEALNIFDEIDDRDEYLILYFNDGSTGIYRNSYVDMFIFSDMFIY